MKTSFSSQQCILIHFGYTLLIVSYHILRKTARKYCQNPICERKKLLGNMLMISAKKRGRSPCRAQTVEKHIYRVEIRSRASSLPLGGKVSTTTCWRWRMRGKRFLHRPEFSCKATLLLILFRQFTLWIIDQTDRNSPHPSPPQSAATPSPRGEGS